MSKTWKKNKYKIYNPYNKFWRHAPAWWNRIQRRKFRYREKVHFMRFGEILRPTKDRGWEYW